MTPEELSATRDRVRARYELWQPQVDGLEVASADLESVDYRSDAFAEAIFLRAFTAYESDLEVVFYHYVTGGLCLQGRPANTYLSVRSEEAARKIVKGGFKFLSWAKPSTTRATADTYIENGWPISTMMAAKSQDLADCERVRNRIAHNSLEASVEFNVVQRNLLGTERLFPVTAGQLLRMRHRRSRRTHIGFYLDVMRETLEAVLEPPA